VIAEGTASVKMAEVRERLRLLGAEENDRSHVLCMRVPLGTRYACVALYPHSPPRPLIKLTSAPRLS